MVQTQLLKDILENNILYEVEEIEGKLEYKLNENNKRIRICETKDIIYAEVNATNTNKYFKINNGQRITKSELEAKSENLLNPIEVYSASEYDEEIFGYIEKTKLLELKPNQNIYTGECILLNTGGSVGAIRLKNKSYEYTVIDNVIVYQTDENYCNVYYLYYVLSMVMDRSMFNYSNTLRGDDLVKAGLIIKIPKERKYNNKIYSSYELQQSIAKNIEEKKQKIDEKYKILTTMEILCNKKIENIIKSIFEKKINDEISINGKTIKLTNINFKKIKLYSNNTKEEYIANKRMGTSEVKESFLENDLVNWYTIRDLNSHVGLYIKEPKTSVLISRSKMEKTFPNSNKKIPIQKDDILISFKQTIGITKIYDSDKPSYCSEAIDILTIANKKKYYNNYIALLLKEEYLKYVQQNVGSTTLNDKLKNKIFLPIPYHDTFDSYVLQQEIFKYIDGKAEEVHSNLNNIKNLQSILKKAEESLWKF